MILNNGKFSKKLITKFRTPFYLLLAFILFCSHDLFIKMESYFLQPNQETTLSLYNGTFESSENTITRDRILDASIVAHGKRTAIDSASWKDQDTTLTQLTFNVGKPGTYVAGVSTKDRNIELTAEKFNAYLKSDGVFDMLKKRTNDSLLDQDAVENYQKHVKAIYQVGDIKSNDWKTILGYPIEFVPQANPYEKHSGEKLDLLLLLDGEPLTNQLVFANYVKDNHTHKHSDEGKAHKHEGGSHEHEHANNTNEHSHNDSHNHESDGEHHSHEDATTSDSHSHAHDDSEKEHSHTNGQQLQTNDKGIVTVDLPEDGTYYVRTISMKNVIDSDTLTHKSKWATLTFGVSHSHDPNSKTDSHSHDHEDENGLPIWVFILASVFIVAILFLIFRKKES
ncbi:DUF4198 domain-containing protein [Winogradskyella sp. 4-2091]|uniref:DUF4198 domain-containing protein n=1 Tax=Winogradskyella sp. 4-2091 TaxID=3381659 RepID=UPI003891ABBF